MEAPDLSYECAYFTCQSPAEFVKVARKVVGHHLCGSSADCFNRLLMLSSAIRSPGYKLT